MRWAASRAAIGARTLLILPEHLIDIALGVFSSHGARRRLACSRNLKFVWHLAVAVRSSLPDRHRRVDRSGSACSAFAAMVWSRAPSSPPRRAGLAGALHQASADFRQFGALPSTSWSRPDLGLVGDGRTYTARLIVERLSVVTFQHLPTRDDRFRHGAFVGGDS